MSVMATEHELGKAFLAKMVQELQAIRNNLEVDNFLIDEWGVGFNDTVIPIRRVYDGPIVVTSILAVYPSGSTSATINLGTPGRNIPLLPTAAGQTEVIPGNPAAGTTFTYTNTTGAPQTLISAKFTLTTSAAVANRFISIQILDASGNVVAENSDLTAIVASSSVTAFFAQGMPNIPNAASGTVLGALPSNVLVLPNWQVKINIAAEDVADTVTAIVFAFANPGPSTSSGAMTVFNPTDLKILIAQDDVIRNLTIAPAGPAYINIFGYADRKQIDRQIR